MNNAWHTIKMVPLDLLGLTPLQLHLLVGSALYAAALAVTRRPILALALVSAFQLVNELVDLLEDRANSAALDLAGHLSDTVATLFLPAAITAIIVLWRSRRR